MTGKGSDKSGKRGGKGGLSGPFGRYEIIEEVGRGAMGTVYRARHQAMGNIIALKILHPQISNKPKFISRFLTEAKASGRLSHPNVVRGVDAGEVDGRHFFAMEFVDGPPLDRVLSTGGPLTERKSLQITLDVAKALNHAAENNVVHRDVKPANILLAGSGTAKLTDLGLAVRRDTDEESGGVTMGTPDYISPEQVRGLPDVDIRADVYSLGITLYQMLTGKTPFSGPPNEVMGKQLTAQLPDPRREGVDVSDTTIRILRKMTEKRREERYQKPENLIRDLEASAAGEGVAVAQAGRALASRRLQRRSRFNIGVAGIMVVFMVFFAVVLLQFIGNGDEDEPRKGGRTSPGRRDDGPGTDDAATKADEELEKAGDALEAAREFWKANPGLFGPAIKKYQDVMRDFGQTWAETCLREIDGIKKSRREKAEAEFGSISTDVEAAALQGRFRDAREMIAGFLKNRKGVFGTTRAYIRAEKLQADLNERIARAILRFEQDAKRLMESGDFMEARNKADSILLMDPEANASRVRKLIREIGTAERKALDAEEERKGREALAKARRMAAKLVKSWKHLEANEPFEAVRAESKSNVVWDLAARELDDLKRLAKLIKAMSDAPGAVGKEMSIDGESGVVEKVSGGYIRLKIGRVVRGFRLRDLDTEEFSKFTTLALVDSDKEMKRAFAVYLLYMGKPDRAGEILSTLDLGLEDTAFYREKMGR